MGASAGTGGGAGAVTVLEAQPRPVPENGPEPDASSSDEGRVPPGDDVVEQSPDSTGSEVAAAACTVSDSGCVKLYIAVADDDTESCVQLALDDCNDSLRPGLAVDVPVAWRIAFGFVSAPADDCVPNTPFAAMDSTIIRGTGSISWNLDTVQPSEIVVDVTLQPSETALDDEPITVSNSDLVNPVGECED